MWPIVFVHYHFTFLSKKKHHQKKKNMWIFCHYYQAHVFAPEWSLKQSYKMMYIILWLCSITFVLHFFLGLS